MNLFKPSAEDCEKLAQVCDKASLYSLLGALIASLGAVLVFLIDNELIVSNPMILLAAPGLLSLSIAVVYCAYRFYQLKQSGEQ